MAHPQSKPPSLQDQLRELEDEAEKKKVILTPEVQTYIQEHLDVVQEKLVNGEPVYKSDLAFMSEVRMWMGIPEEWREKYVTIGDMLASNEHKESYKRHISIPQWLDLLHVAKAKGEEKEWIDKEFEFPGGWKIKAENLYLNDCTSLTSLPEGLSVGGDLHLSSCTSLTSLPEKLSVRGNLWLHGCTSLTSLPDGLSVAGDLSLSKKLNNHVKKDAERLQEEGKIKGEIIYND